MPWHLTPIQTARAIAKLEENWPFASYRSLLDGHKIKEITHGDNGNVMKKYKIVEANDVTHNLTF
jgi:hypothetical protein